jgi:hypothetical protein
MGIAHGIAGVSFWGKKESMKSDCARFPPFIYRDMLFTG